MLISDREYQCLGQWEEDGMLLTLTRRRDVDDVECFVGFHDDQGSIFIKRFRRRCLSVKTP
jgi:hypothetical protein